MRRALPALAAAVMLSGCALRSDVTRLERQLVESERSRVRADSAATANLAAIARMVQGLYDSLASQNEVVGRLRGDLRVDLYNIQQQLVAVQELTGQSQQRLSEVRAQLEQRTPPVAATPGAPGATPATPGAAEAAPAEPGAEQLLDLSLQQLRRGSPGTARIGFAEFLRRFPSHPRAVDAEYFTAVAWNEERRTDSASVAFRRVTQRYPNSPRAASSWYALGLQALAAGRTADARTAFNRVVTQFPTSEEAALARERLQTLPQR